MGPAPLDALSRRLYVGSRFASSIAISTIYRLLQWLLTGPPIATPEIERSLQARIIDLLQADWRDVREGLLPPATVPWREYAEAAPAMLLDLPRYWLRSRAGRFVDLDPGAAPMRYPNYYARNFHYQSEGYLGHTSARLYDLQVELLFGGCADLMRRRLVPPLVRFAREQGHSPERPLRVLDVACGTGHLLRMIGEAIPGVRLFGLDLSPHYIARARATLPRELEVSLVCENAEQQPFPDRHFDAVSCLYLFHELPGHVRARVFGEIARVARPGARIVIGDSLQSADAPELVPVLQDFPRRFHEPYYLSWLRDDLGQRMTDAGLAVEEVQEAFLTKIAIARRP